MLLWSNGVRRGHLNHRGQGRIATAQQRHRRRRRSVVDEDGIVRRYVVTYLHPDRLQKQDSILIGCQPPAFQPEHTCFIMNKFEHVPWRWRSLYSEVQSLNVLISGKWLGRGVPLQCGPKFEDVHIYLGKGRARSPCTAQLLRQD